MKMSHTSVKVEHGLVITLMLMCHLHGWVWATLLCPRSINICCTFSGCKSY